MAVYIINRGGVEDTRLEAKDTKKSEAKNSPSKNRPSQGQGQECSRPRIKNTGATVLRKKTSSKIFFRRSQKIGLQKFFSGVLQKKVFKNIFQAIHKILTIQKILLPSSRGQGNFRGLKASRPWPRTLKCVLEAKDVIGISTSDH